MVIVPKTEKFPDNYWENSLGTFDYMSISLEDESPILLWGGEKASFNIKKFKIYRAITNSYTPPNVTSSDYKVISIVDDLVYF